jgi:5-methylcytosine-specific restriction endonuclease McrA
MATTYTQTQRFYRLGDSCHYCGCPLDGHDPQRAKTRDHKQPRSRGGSEHPSNIVAACDLCNRTKANMTEAEFNEWKRRGRPNKADYMREIGLTDTTANGDVTYNADGRPIVPICR